MQRAKRLCSEFSRIGTHILLNFYRNVYVEKETIFIMEYIDELSVFALSGAVSS